MTKASHFEYKESLSLENLRATLIRLEETIIFALIERCQFATNNIIYKSNPGEEFAVVDGTEPITSSFMEYFLLETEKVHARVRRYTSPEEHAFFPNDLPSPILPNLDFPPVLHPNTVNINPRIMKVYINEIVPKITTAGHDNNYGSSATCDVACLQALSKRIHYGKFVAEAKFQENPEEYSRLIREGNRDGLMALLTNAAVENRLLRRVVSKASLYGADITDSSITNSEDNSSSVFQVPQSCKIAPTFVRDIYAQYIIPMTKDVEVDYLMQRLS